MPLSTIRVHKPHPLTLPEILEIVFAHVRHYDLALFRLVCQLWRAEAEREATKRGLTNWRHLRFCVVYDFALFSLAGFPEDNESLDKACAYAHHELALTLIARRYPERDAPPDEILTLLHCVITSLHPQSHILFAQIVQYFAPTLEQEKTQTRLSSVLFTSVSQLFVHNNLVNIVKAIAENLAVDTQDADYLSLISICNA